MEQNMPNTYPHLVKAVVSDVAPLISEYQSVRATTEALAAPLSDEDCVAQSMPDCSPAKWHLAHTTWFFETFVLEREIPGYKAVDTAYRVLFNSYYQSVGEQYARPQRGLLTRPSRREVMAYRSAIDARMLDLLARGVSAATAAIIELGLNHEQQHQELLLTDIKHLLGLNPMVPAYCTEDVRGEAQPVVQASAESGWQAFPGGLHSFGHQGPNFGFDNEGPRHRVHLEAFMLAMRPVSNREYLGFIEAGGYTRPEFWLSAGWDTICAQHWQAPLYWHRLEGDWRIYTLHGLQSLALNEPVCHLSYFEADAFARYAGARLPTEYEWEWAAAGMPVEGNLLESGALHPRESSGDTRGLKQLYGDVWEWTASAYAPYPGFRAASGALGEYNGKFMCSQLVLRGGSCVSPRAHIRPSYRNFFAPTARWQFSGLRLARDIRDGAGI
jgi:ergothioneine biosynthesis protein EgtB